MSSNTSSPLFMKRQPSVSLQRAMVSPGVSRGTRKLDVPCSMPTLRIGVGVDDEQAGVVAVGDELLAPVDHPFLAVLHGAGLHRGLRHVVGQPAVGGAARLGQAVCEQELRILDQALEPFLLQMARREIAQQHRHLPVLHQLVGEPGIAARDLLGDQREGLHLGRLVELDAAELLRHAERADADLVGAVEDFRRQPAFGLHVPFALPVAADERDDDVVDEIAADCRISRCSSERREDMALLLGRSRVRHHVVQDRRIDQLQSAAHRVDVPPRLRLTPWRLIASVMPLFA